MGSGEDRESSLMPVDRQCGWDQWVHRTAVSCLSGSPCDDNRYGYGIVNGAQDTGLRGDCF